MPYSIITEKPAEVEATSEKGEEVSLETKQSTLFKRVFREAAAVCLVAIPFFAYHMPQRAAILCFGLAIGVTAILLESEEKSWKDHVTKNPKLIPVLETLFVTSMIAAIALAYWHPIAAVPFGIICGVVYTLSSDYLKSQLSKDTERKPVHA